ncbi:MAG: PorP/SprF family type IX secretion system membrane protein [Bacteroidetes bacterium]|nr:PorP/SprF family type IX secretion system membrane protein [Bacteroidota bacterium]
MKKLIVICVIFINLCNLCYTQDIHFTQFFEAPIIVNPSFTGGFNGNQRIMLNYRNQWNSIGEAYNTLALSVDFSMLKGKLNRYDYTGAGIVFINEKAGNSRLNTLHFGIPLVYHKQLNEEQFIALSAHPGIVKRSIDYSNLEFDNQWDGFFFDPGLSTGENFQVDNLTYFDISSGLLWYYDSQYKNINLYGGISLHHINRAKQSFFDESDRLKRNVHITGGGQIEINRKLNLLPSFLVLKQGTNFMTSIGSFVKYNIIDNNVYITQSYLYLGAWYRFGDAIMMVLKFDYENFSVGMSYDINVSGLYVASKLKGGPEISLSAAFPFSKAKQGKPIPCPRLD